MAKKDDKVVVSKMENTEEMVQQAPNDITTQETQTQTDNGEGNETQTSSISTEPTNQGGGDLEATSEENTEMDSSTEDEGDGSKGNQDGGEVVKPVKVSLYEKMREIAQPVFEKSDAKVLYFTKDFIPFFNKSDASKHAAELDSDLVIPVNRLV